MVVDIAKLAESLWRGLLTGQGKSEARGMPKTLQGWINNVHHMLPVQWFRECFKGNAVMS